MISKLASSSNAFLRVLKLTIAAIMMNPHIFVMHVVLNKHFMLLLDLTNGPNREGELIPGFALALSTRRSLYAIDQCT